MVQQVGYIDGISEGYVCGWAVEPNGTTGSAVVEFLIDGRVIGSVHASELRADLLANSIGDGRCGFRYALPRELSFNRQSILVAQLEQSKTPLLKGGLPLETYVRDESVRFEDDIPHWELIARHDAMWGVLSADRYREKDMAPEVRAEFFDTGEAFINEKLSRVTELFGALPQGTAVDFGCGVGRLTMPLAKRFPRAIGIDVSETMIRHATENCAVADISNAAFCQSAEVLGMLAPEGIEYLNFFIVFQHIPEGLGLTIFATLLKAMNPGGIGCVHFVTSNLDQDGRAVWVNPVPIDGDVVGMQMNSYALSSITRTMYQSGIRTFQADFEQHGVHLGVILFFRKAAG